MKQKRLEGSGDRTLNLVPESRRACPRRHACRPHAALLSAALRHRGRCVAQVSQIIHAERRLARLVCQARARPRPWAAGAAGLVNGGGAAGQRDVTLLPIPQRRALPSQPGWRRRSVRARSVLGAFVLAGVRVNARRGGRRGRPRWRRGRAGPSRAGRSRKQCDITAKRLALPRY